jgi:hypothetical protein
VAQLQAQRLHRQHQLKHLQQHLQQHQLKRQQQT